MKNGQLKLYVPEKAPSPRAKKVAGEIKRILSEIFIRNDIPPVWNSEGELVLSPGNLTITHVKLSPDLLECQVFVMPLANQHIEKVKPYFELATSVIRKLFAERSVLRFVPNFHFYLDPSFSASERIDALLANNKKRREENAPESTNLHQES